MARHEVTLWATFPYGKKVGKVDEVKFISEEDRWIGYVDGIAECGVEARPRANGFYLFLTETEARKAAKFYHAKRLATLKAEIEQLEASR